VATRVMRRILVDYARAGKWQKRGEGLEHIALRRQLAQAIAAGTGRPSCQPEWRDRALRPGWPPLFYELIRNRERIVVPWNSFRRRPLNHRRINN